MFRIISTVLAYLLIISNSLLSAQSVPDISGHWNGTAAVPLGEDLIVEYQFEQTGSVIKGYSIQRSRDGKDSSRFNFLGTIKDKIIEFKGTDFIYKTNAACLSNVKLSYSKSGDQETLSGKWSGDWGLNTCPPGSGGKVELIKVNRKSLASRQTATVAPVNSIDDIGLALYEELQQRNYYALLIGIDTYLDEKIVGLDHPVSDMKSLGQVLLGNYSFTNDHTISLQNPTRDEIIIAFDDLSRKVTNKDQLLIFYAGHGIWDAKLQQGYWLPSDASLDSKARWLSNSTIRDYIGGISSKHTLLITDACFSGGIFKERSVQFNSGKAMLEMYKLPSRKAMTSGTLTTVPDKSVFVHYLIKNLETNEQPLLSTEDLFRTFKIAVINNSPNGQVPQYGTIGQTGDEGGDFIFLRKVD